MKPTNQFTTTLLSALVSVAALYSSPRCADAQVTGMSCNEYGSGTTALRIGEIYIVSSPESAARVDCIGADGAAQSAVLSPLGLPDFQYGTPALKWFHSESVCVEVHLLGTGSTVLERRLGSDFAGREEGLLAGPPGIEEVEPRGHCLGLPDRVIRMDFSSVLDQGSVALVTVSRDGRDGSQPILVSSSVPLLLPVAENDTTVVLRQVRLTAHSRPLRDIVEVEIHVPPVSDMFD